MPDAAQADLDSVRKTSERWMRAWVEQDRAELERVLAPDFTLIIGNAPTGRVARAEWLAMVPRYVCKRLTYRDVQLRSLDSLVLMSAIADFDASIDGADRSGRFFVVDAWRRSNDGSWQVAARYSTRAEAAPDASLARMFAD